MIGKIGIAVIILAFVFSAMSPYVLLFTIPVFLMGVLLLWFSKSKLLAKILWTVLPLLLWCPAFWLFMFLYGTISTATAQKLDFIFPEGFKGSVVLVGSMPCGQPVKKKDSREQLFVPANGIVLYQGVVEDGHVNHNYYYQLDNGKLQSIPDRANYMYFSGEKDPPSTHDVGVWLGATGTTSISEPEPTIKYHWIALTVASKDSITSDNDSRKQRQFEIFTDSLITDCLSKRSHSK